MRISIGRRVISLFSYNFYEHFIERTNLIFILFPIQFTSANHSVYYCTCSILQTHFTPNVPRRFSCSFVNCNYEKSCSYFLENLLFLTYLVHDILGIRQQNFILSSFFLSKKIVKDVLPWKTIVHDRTVQHTRLFFRMASFVMILCV